jgi:COMPASS component SWD3
MTNLDGKCIRVLDAHEDPVTSIDVGKDGGVVASASYDGKIHIWDGKSGNCVTTLEAGRSVYVLSFEISPSPEET